MAKATIPGLMSTEKVGAYSSGNLPTALQVGFRPKTWNDWVGPDEYATWNYNSLIASITLIKTKMKLAGLNDDEIFNLVKQVINNQAKQLRGGIQEISDENLKTILGQEKITLNAKNIEKDFMAGGASRLGDYLATHRLDLISIAGDKNYGQYLKISHSSLDNIKAQRVMKEGDFIFALWRFPKDLNNDSYKDNSFSMIIQGDVSAGLRWVEQKQKDFGDKSSSQTTLSINNLLSTASSKLEYKMETLSIEAGNSFKMMLFDGEDLETATLKKDWWKWDSWDLKPKKLKGKPKNPALVVNIGSTVEGVVVGTLLQEAIGAKQPSGRDLSFERNFFSDSYGVPINALLDFKTMYGSPARASPKKLEKLDEYQDVFVLALMNPEVGFLMGDTQNEFEMVGYYNVEEKKSLSKTELKKVEKAEKDADENGGFKVEKEQPKLEGKLFKSKNTASFARSFRVWDPSIKEENIDGVEYYHLKWILKTKDGTYLDPDTSKPLNKKYAMKVALVREPVILLGKVPRLNYLFLGKSFTKREDMEIISLIGPSNFIVDIKSDFEYGKLSKEESIAEVRQDFEKVELFREAAKKNKKD